MSAGGFSNWEVWLGFQGGGYCWWCGQVPNVGLRPVLKEKGPSRQSKWLPVGSDLPVLQKNAWVSLGSLKMRAVKSFLQRFLSITFIFSLSQPLQALATARIQRQAEGFQC